ncbi:hypothetical protein [Streptomyces antibioticus]|uniref:hypothetical protein n=1 Tax=Streptomyces antibioticus TaxID=1890 RepID=UPI0033CC8C8F
MQNRHSPAVGDSEPERRPTAALALVFLPWSPLGGISRSVLDGPGGSTEPAPGEGPFGAFHAVARERGVSPQQACLARLFSRSLTLVAIPGASRPETAATRPVRRNWIRPRRS